MMSADSTASAPNWSSWQHVSGLFHCWSRTAAILVACVPFVLTNAVAGLEILRPMAIVVLGGLVTTALVNLYVLPALYLWLKSEPASGTS